MSNELKYACTVACNLSSVRRKFYVSLCTSFVPYVVKKRLVVCSIQHLASKISLSALAG
jgi:hypothetical protein